MVKWRSEHGESTARKRTSEEKQYKPAVKKTAQQKVEEEWRDAQRTMATQCDNCILFGEHSVDQESVLEELKLVGNPTVEQRRPSSENSDVRIMKTSDGFCYWTNGLTHDKLRKAKKFTVYRRIGGKSQFEHVSGIRHKKDPN